jgi:cellulose synthase (UDP-forming)
MPVTVAEPPSMAARAATESPQTHRLLWVSGRKALAREQWLTVLAAILAVAAAMPVVSDSIALSMHHVQVGAFLPALASLGLIVLAAVLVYGTLAYLAARFGHLARLRAATSDTSPDTITNDGTLDQASLVVLIPAYLEDAEVVSRALMSAALQPHPKRRVVLLIDDPPTIPPSGGLKDVRALPDHIQELLRPTRYLCESALANFDARVADTDAQLAGEARHLADLCRHVAAWFEHQAEGHAGADGSASFFADTTFRPPAARWLQEARRWESVGDGVGVAPSLAALRAVYLHLVATFSVEISSFERKRFINLSHAPNKAMNVNTYLGLLGGSYRQETDGAGMVLSACPLAGADLVIPDADFALILDADTIVSPDYTRKLLPHFGRSGGESLAVVQSPYSTFPGNRGVLQRIAGAQTDVQYVIHQGLTHYDATYWVGANALVRVAALREVAVTGIERGFKIVKFISDRTLIEDTDASIELVSRGWRLHNHLERLSFSMTPPDFGALLVQRQRWANGGLLIVPKLLRYLKGRDPLRARLTEGFMRVHYLVSLGPVSLALLIALGVAWDQQLRTGGLSITGLIYYAIYARDLHLLGYRWYDVMRVLALNVILIPVNLAGMASSIIQALTGRKPRFGRTPKVHGRTSVPARFIVAELALLGLWCAHAGLSLSAGRLVVTAFMLVHALLAAYAISVFIGFQTGATDLVAGFGRRAEQSQRIV